MNLPRSVEPELARVLRLTDRQNHKREQDVEIGNGRLILTSPDGTRYSVTVNNLGMLSATAV